MSESDFQPGIQAMQAHAACVDKPSTSRLKCLFFANRKRRR